VKRKKEKERKKSGSVDGRRIRGKRKKEKRKKNGVCVKLKGCCVFCKTHSS
jgi:hypothetical protein